MFQTYSDGTFGNFFLIVCFVLYFVQGIPYGFQTRYLPLLFRMSGMNLAQVGLFKLLMIPWMLKPVWALLVDRYFTKKFWLGASLMTLSFLCILSAFITPTYVFHLAVIMFLFNVITSVQDIALDSIVIDSLHPSQLAHGNVAQVVGFKLGGLFSGGIFSLLSDIVSWEHIQYTLAIIYIIGFIISLLGLPDENFIDPAPSSVDFGTSSVTHTLSRNSGHAFTIKGNTRSTSQELVPETERNTKCHIWKLLETEGTVWMLIFILFYKVGEQGATNMYPMFMLDNGISPHTTGFWTGLTGQAFSVLGSVIGGIMNYRKLFSRLKLHILIRGISVLILWLGMLMSNSFSTLSYVLSIAAYQAVSLTGGAITTLTYTLAMTISQKASKYCRASHYTMITTVDILGRLIISSLVGGATDEFGYSFVFFCLTVSSFLILINIFFAPLSVWRH